MDAIVGKKYEKGGEGRKEEKEEERRKAKSPFISFRHT